MRLSWWWVWAAFMAGQLVNGIMVRVDHPDTFGNTIVYVISMLILLIVAAILYAKLQKESPND